MEEMVWSKWRQLLNIAICSTSVMILCGMPVYRTSSSVLELPNGLKMTVELVEAGVVTMLQLSEMAFQSVLLIWQFELT